MSNEKHDNFLDDLKDQFSKKILAEASKNRKTSFEMGMLDDSKGALA